MREQVSQLRQSEIAAAAQRRRQEAIERFWEGGELRRLLHPALPALHTPALRAHLPNTFKFVVSGEAGQLVRFQSGLAGRGLANKARLLSEERIEVSALLPSEISCTLALVLECGLHQCECTTSTQVVSTVRDRLSVVEHALAVEGLARKCLCPGCTHQALTPVTMERDGGRHMSTWCSICSTFVDPVVDPIDYCQLSFLPRGAAVTRIPLDSEESLRAPISSDDLDYYLGQSPNNSAAGPDRLPYELLKGAPLAFKETLRECLNSILEGGAAPPESWLGGLVRFLFKKGDPLDIACYRPVCLLDTTYKVLSGILTDRLYRMCEKHGLLDPSQEGFRKLRSTQRQVQSLHWAIEDRAQRRALLYVSYLDFESAFNSPDHEGLWRWLRELNVPDVDLLQALYKAAHYVADLP